VNWKEDVARGEFANIAANPVQQRIDFPSAQKARFIKLSALQTIPPGFSAAEIGVIGR